MTLGVWTLIGLLAAANVLRFAMHAKEAAEHLYAALSACWPEFLRLVLLRSQANRTRHLADTGGFSRMTALYFSFVKLATLGYGDNVPRTEVARGFAIVEGVGGQLFFAVMIARLLSLHTRWEPRTKS